MPHLRGEDHKLAQTCEEDVRLIRELYNDGMFMTVIARKFELSYSTVYDICKEKTWKHVV